MDVKYLKGIGDKRAGLLNRLGLFTCDDLVEYYPRAYEDRTVYKKLSELEPGNAVCVRATVAKPVTHSFVRQGLELYKTAVFDESGMLRLTFFNAPYVSDSLIQGETYVFFGRVTGGALSPELNNPIFEPEGRQGRTTGRILPKYPSTAGCPQSLLRNAAEQALDKLPDAMPDTLPEDIRRRYGLCHLSFAVRNIHFPQTWDALEVARRRLVFEELLTLQLGLARLKKHSEVIEGRRFEKVDLGDFYALLGFDLTEGQKAAIADATGDMGSGRLMGRLIQGDVGSGKTAVAAACALTAIRNGCQAALMAPTEILAEQHYQSLAPLMTRLGVGVQLLTGRMSAAQKKAVRHSLASGSAGLCIGTHALLSETVKFQNLGLVIMDEQHRFGVRQRAELSEKADGVPPHRLILSATPIPRTLSLTLFGDLDVTVMRGLPPGRSPVKTYPVTEDYRGRINAFARKQVALGRQVYCICPLIDEPADEFADPLSPSGAAAVEKYAGRLRDEVFPDLRVGVVHGRMKGKDKETAMREFAEGGTDILVATTVVEVGVNVPNASLIIVENAERFGLSQLHQLRGRVGRGTHESYCVLFLQTSNETSEKRMEIMRSSNDGFEIAEADLELRGPGDFFGDRQHGLPAFKLADLSGDAGLVRLSRESADAILASDPGLRLPEHRALLSRVDRLMENMGRD